MPDRNALMLAASKSRIVDRRKGRAADFIKAVASSDHMGVDLLPHKLAPGVETAAVLLLLADIAGHSDPRLVEEATGRPVTAKSAPGRRAA